MGGMATSLCVDPDRGEDAALPMEISSPSRDVFVDGPARTEYKFHRPSMQLFRKDGMPVMRISKYDFQGNSIRVVKGAHGFKDDLLLRSDGPTTGRSDDWFSIARRNASELSREDYCGKYRGLSTVHIKGFSSGLANVYDDCIVDRLAKFKVLVWDGEDYNDSGFTRLVPLYLNNNPAGVVVAFRFRHDVPLFNWRWSSWMAKHPGRFCVIQVDAERDAKALQVQQEVSKYCRSPTEEQTNAFLLSRIALKTTGAKEVVALGGEGPTSWEAKASFLDGVHWTVYAVSRGSREKRPSLCDFAHKCLTTTGNKGAHVHLVMGRDPKESDAFANDF